MKIVTMGRKRVDDIDFEMENLEEVEAKERGELPGRGAGRKRAAVGTVEKYFDKLEVVAIALSGRLRVGDLIEIGSEDEAVRQRVGSMQIDRKEVEEAGEGASVGIKLRWRVDEGASVYRMD